MTSYFQVYQHSVCDFCQPRKNGVKEKTYGIGGPEYCRGDVLACCETCLCKQEKCVRRRHAHRPEFVDDETFLQDLSDDNDDNDDDDE
jgi:hypothetical protein